MATENQSYLAKVTTNSANEQTVRQLAFDVWRRDLNERIFVPEIELKAALNSGIKITFLFLSKRHTHYFDNCTQRITNYTLGDEFTKDEIS